MMNKVLVICPSTPGWPEWPVGMAYVLACLERAEIPFDFIDMATTPNWERTMVALLKRNTYLALCSGGLIGFHRFFSHLIELLQRHSPTVPFVLGGQIIKDGNDKLLFETIGIDYGYSGEAEVSLADFLMRLQAGEKVFPDVPGIAYRDSAGRIIRNPQARLDLVEDNILPAWHHFNCDFYIANSSFAFLGRHLRYMPILSGRGCVGKCGFCSPSVGGFRKRPIAHVIEEIEHLNANYDYDTLCFLNEMFYPRAKEVREFCEAYLRLPERKAWFVQLRIDSNLDVDTLRLMRRAGCIAVSAGIESGSDKILAIMNKKITSDQTRAFFARCREAGLPACGTVIIGYDGETEDDLRRTFDLLIEEDISSGEALLFAYQGTKIYDRALEEGLIEDETAHLDACSGNLFQANSPNLFCNLTSMDEETFFAVAQREVRRYYRHLYDNYTVRNLTYDIDTTWRWTTATLRGECRNCGTPTEHSFVMMGGGFMGCLGPGINRNIICPSCFRPLAYSIHEATNMPDLASHLDHLRSRFSLHDKVVLCGINHDLDFVLRTDIFGLDSSKILGILPLSPSHPDRYITYPMLTPREMVDLAPDSLLLLDPTYDTAKLRALFEAEQRTVPEILRPIPDNILRTVRASACLVQRVNRVFLRLFGVSAREALGKVLPLRRRDV